MGHPVEVSKGLWISELWSSLIPGMKSHGEWGYDSPEAGGGLRGDALAQDLPLGGEDGGRGVVAARLDALKGVNSIESRQDCQQKCFKPIVGKPKVG